MRLQFWEKYPAFFYGLILYLGFLFALQTAWVLVPFILLLHKKKLMQACLLFLLPCVLIHQFYFFPLSGEKVEGVFHIHSLKRKEKFGGGWAYSGSLHTTDGRIQCRCFAKEYNSPRMSYRVSGTIRRQQGGYYVLKTQGTWKVENKRSTLADLRYHAKTSVKHYIEQHYPHARSAHFLTGMITGELEDLVLRNEFNVLGVSHLIAISGLHFSLILLVFHLLFRLFLPYKWEAVLLMCLMSGYLLFIGETPSVLRAWCSVLLFLMGHLFEKRSSSLNSLGAALLFSLLLNPLSATSLSLQLSFLATAGILFFYAPCNQLIMWWIPKLPLKDVIRRNLLWQHTYIFASFFRAALALTLAVHFALLPLLLSTFHQFAFNSLIYNLFLPFLASAALLFFLIALPLGSWGHYVNSHYCNWILKISESPPLLFKSYAFDTMPSWLLTLWFLALLAAAIASKIKEKRDRFGVANDALLDHV